MGKGDLETICNWACESTSTVPANQWPKNEPALSSYVGTTLASQLGDNWVRFTEWSTKGIATQLRAESEVTHRYNTGGDRAGALSKMFCEYLRRHETNNGSVGYFCDFTDSDLQSKGPTVRIVMHNTLATPGQQDGSRLDPGVLIIGDITFETNGRQLFIRREHIVFFQPSTTLDRIRCMIQEDVSQIWGDGPRADRDVLRDFKSGGAGWREKRRSFPSPMSEVSGISPGFDWGMLLFSLLQVLQPLIGLSVLVAMTCATVIAINLASSNNPNEWTKAALIASGLTCGILYLVERDREHCFSLIALFQGRTDHTWWRLYKLCRRQGRLYSVHPHVVANVFARPLADWRTWSWHSKPVKPWRSYDLLAARLGFGEYPLANDNARGALVGYVDRLVTESRIQELFESAVEGQLREAINGLDLTTKEF